MIHKALLMGVGGTVAYGGLVALVASVVGKPLADFTSPTDIVAQLALLPLLPGLLPGLLVARKLSPGALLPAPFVNAALIYLWLRRRERRQSDCCS